MLFLLLLIGCAPMAHASCRMDAPVRLADVGPVTLAYQDVGDPRNPALLLLMGLGGQLTDWPASLLAELCEQGYRLIRFDNRDSGLTTWRTPPETPWLTYNLLRYRLGLSVHAPYALQDMAGDALGLMDRLGIERFHVLGASLGGMVAQHLAVMAPSRVDSLTLLMSSSGADDLPPPQEGLRTLMTSRDLPSREEAIERQVALLAALGSPRYPAEQLELRRAVERSFERAYRPDGIERQILAVLADGNREPMLATLRPPVEVIHGTDDPLLPVEHGIRLAESIPGARLTLIDGLAHRYQSAFRQPLLNAILANLQRSATQGGLAHANGDRVQTGG
nr:alpha/beta hydrolase [Stutzerimonas azotifigens]